MQIEILFGPRRLLLVARTFRGSHHQFLRMLRPFREIKWVLRCFHPNQWRANSKTMDSGQAAASSDRKRQNDDGYSSKKKLKKPRWGAPKSSSGATGRTTEPPPPSRRPHQESDTAPCKTFEAMNLKPDLLRGIFAYGFEKPSAIQQRAIRPVLRGRDVIAQSQSGTGKTGCFGISALQLLSENSREPQVLIVSPTRELAE